MKIRDYFRHQREFPTQDYEAFLKKRKKKHSLPLFWKFLERKFLDEGVDINLASSGKVMFFEAFWQLYILNEWIRDLTIQQSVTNLRLNNDL